MGEKYGYKNLSCPYYIFSLPWQVPRDSRVCRGEEETLGGDRRGADRKTLFPVGLYICRHGNGVGPVELHLLCMNKKNFFSFGSKSNSRFRICI